MDEMRYTVENEKDREEIKKMKKDNAAKDLSSFFDSFIKKNKFVRKYDFGNGLEVELHPCSMGELMEAELFVRGQNPGIPMDSMVRLRSAAILAQSIETLCGVEITDDTKDEEENMIRRTTLYTKLLSLPPDLIEKMYECYIDCIDKQAELYKNPLKLKEDITNFSTAPSDK